MKFRLNLNTKKNALEFDFRIHAPSTYSMLQYSQEKRCFFFTRPHIFLLRKKGIRRIIKKEINYLISESIEKAINILSLREIQLSITPFNFINAKLKL